MATTTKSKRPAAGAKRGAAKAGDPVPATLAALAGLSDQEVLASAKEASAQAAAWSGRFCLLFAELERRGAWRDDGAASAEAWIVGATAASKARARAEAALARRLVHLPRLAEGLCAGSISFDQAAVVAPLATARSEAALADAAASGASVAELGELARAALPPRPPAVLERSSVVFNPSTRTMTARFGADRFAWVQALVEARAKRIGSDGTTPWDERQGDALVDLLAQDESGGRPLGGSASSSSSHPLVVAHVPLESLIDAEGPSALFGELERGGLIAGEVVTRLACEGAVVVAVDDAEGHTMYEGRERRHATEAQRREIMRRDRHCRFPGCAHIVFSVPHHMAEWQRDEGRTDIDNLIALCVSHHGLLHSKGWSVSGDANAEVTFAGPQGRALTSRPSPSWTRVSTQAGRRLGGQGPRAGPSG